MLDVNNKSMGLGQSATGAAPARASSQPKLDQANSGNRPTFASPVTAKEIKDFKTKVPIVTGEIHFKGSMAVDGLLIGQIGSNNGLSLKQRTTTATSQAELTGEFSFKDMVRVNGHIAGSVYSQNGTIIVDSAAKVDANVDVAVAVICGTVNGDIIARQRVELGPASKIHGNIWTRSIVIKDGAIFEGVCRMIDEKSPR